MFENMRILLTGGTGSLGKAIIKRADNEGWDCDFVIFSRDETRQSQLKNKYPQYEYFLGDVAKYGDIARVMRRNIDVVFHLAAYKQVPSSQNNVPATLETNITGSLNIMDAALEYGVRQVVASSTDKASQPVNVYGISKAMMEGIFQYGHRFEETSFHLARYGNVVCSNASVIPLFEKQTKEGGPLTVTHVDMTRFWITLDQAIDLLLLALQKPSGTIVVPKAGAMPVVEVAKAVGPGLEIKDIGIRAGEKIHESLVSEAESFFTEQDDEYFYIHPYGSKYYQPTPFTYTSDKAPHLTKKEMLEMIADYHRKYE